MQHVKEFIQSVLKKYGITEDLKAVFEAWNVLGEEITLGSELYEVGRGVLNVRVHSPIALHKLYCEKNKLIEAMNARLKKRYVKDIKFELFAKNIK